MVKRLCIIPMYNEEQTIGAVLDIALKKDWDILVIDANSTDKSGEIVTKRFHKSTRHNYVFMETNSLAKALLYGIDYVIIKKYDLLYTCDADGEYCPSEIFRLSEQLDDFDLVVGNRFHNKLVPKKNLPLINILNNKYGLKIKDPKSGARVYKVSSLKKINLTEIYSSHYGLSLEMMMKFLDANLKIKFVPFKYYKKVRERILKSKDLADIEARDLCRIIGHSNFSKGKKMIEDFCKELGFSFKQWESEFSIGNEVVIAR